MCREILKKINEDVLRTNDDINTFINLIDDEGLRMNIQPSLIGNTVNMSMKKKEAFTRDVKSGKLYQRAEEKIKNIDFFKNNNEFVKKEPEVEDKDKQSK